MHRRDIDPELILNGKPASESLLKSMIAGLNSAAVRTEKGGYLFKAAQNGDRLLLSIIPCIHQGERNHHYDLELLPGAAYVLIGTLTPGGVFTVLFAPDRKTGLTGEMKSGYQSTYAKFFEFLISRGLDPGLSVDRITTDLLLETGLFSHRISTVGEINS